MGRFIADNAARALDEAIEEHDPDVVQSIADILRWIDEERRRAGERMDTPLRARLGDLSFTVAKLQQRTHRIAALHAMARRNQYDRY